MTKYRVDMTDPKKTVTTAEGRITFRTDSITAVEEKSFATIVWTGTICHHVSESYEYIVERIKSSKE